MDLMKHSEEIDPLELPKSNRTIAVEQPWDIWTNVWVIFKTSANRTMQECCEDAACIYSWSMLSSKRVGGFKQAVK
jgi:hypothetical protein